MYPPWTQICIIYSWLRKLKLRINVTMSAYFRHFTGSDKVTRSGGIRILHQSFDFLVVDKCFDVLINSDDPDVKVTLIPR